MGRESEGAAATPGLRAAGAQGHLVWPSASCLEEAGAQVCDCLGSPSQHLLGERCCQCIA